MVGRSKSYDAEIAKLFEDLSYAQGFFNYCIEKQKFDTNEALRETIRNMGIKAFADKSGLSLQAVSDFVAKRQSWSTDKMAKHILQVFKMKMRVVFDVAS